MRFPHVDVGYYGSYPLAINVIIRADLYGKGNYIEYLIGPEILTSFTNFFPSYNRVIYFFKIGEKQKKMGKVAIFLKYRNNFYFQLTDVPRFSFHHKIQKISN